LREAWEPKPGDRVIRHPRQEEMSPVRLTVTTRKVPSRAFASPLILIYAFGGLITVGTLLLLLPISHRGTGFTPFVTALFTATSATTVTGLVVQDTAEYWTRTGQVFILGLMFVGGLGFMTIATFLLILIGGRISLAQRLLVRESLGVNQLGGLVRITIGIVLVAAGIQVVGFAALFVRFSFLYSPAEAIWQAVFHAVSGFNNAGFVALKESDGMAAFQEDELVLGIMFVLIVLGGIGYWVMVDVVKVRKFSLFTLTTKLVLIMTAALLLIGTFAFLAFEYQNPDTLGPLPVERKLMVSLFESASGRTAGFSTVDFGKTEQHTNFFFTSLMFIGGASASVAGGIKINTFAVVLVAVLSTMKGRSRASAFGREIPGAQVQRAMVIGALSIGLVFLVALALVVSQSGFDFIDLFFESVSAFGTVGLSTGLTSELSSSGHVILIVTMFVGRLGPITIGIALAQQTRRDAYRYPQERVTIG
jgi:trk system potassium uptake protein TrkH